MSEENEEQIAQDRGEAGAAMGETIGSAYAGPMGGIVGKYIGEKLGKYIGEKVGDKAEDKIKELNKEDEEKEDKPEKKKGGSCGGGSQGQDQEQTSDGGQCHASPETPKFKLEIEENEVPENWWDQLPDFDPRVYDAIAMEKAAACVKYIFYGLPDVHELENSMEARGFRKICPRLKTKVPRTKIIRPKEIIYDTTVDTFIKKDQTY